MPNGNTTPNAATGSPSPQPVHDPRRETVRKRLVQLVSAGTAQLYIDACTHMDMRPPLATTTHTVANLLRETESSLRAVLQPLTAIAEETCATCGKPTSKTRCECGRPILQTHKAQVVAILSVLGVDEKDPLSAAWEYIIGKGHKYAHRKNLEAPRAVDSDFEEYWSQMTDVLEGVLDRFETNYVGVLVKLDELIAQPNPTTAHAKMFCSNFTNNQTTHDYFFGKLENPTWLPLLIKEGVFKKVPDTVYFEDGSFRYPPWPPAPYLQRMTTVRPAEVATILRDIEDTENEAALGTLVEIAAGLPEEHRLKLMDKLTTWV